MNVVPLNLARPPNSLCADPFTRTGSSLATLLLNVLHSALVHPLLSLCGAVLLLKSHKAGQHGLHVLRRQPQGGHPLEQLPQRGLGAPALPTTPTALQRGGFLRVALISVLKPEVKPFLQPFGLTQSKLAPQHYALVVEVGRPHVGALGVARKQSLKKIAPALHAAVPHLRRCALAHEQDVTLLRNSIQAPRRNLLQQLLVMPSLNAIPVKLCPDVDIAAELLAHCAEGCDHCPNTPSLRQQLHHPLVGFHRLIEAASSSLQHHLHALGRSVKVLQREICCPHIEALLLLSNVNGLQRKLCSLAGSLQFTFGNPVGHKLAP
eukprot:RCo051049